MSVPVFVHFKTGHFEAVPFPTAKEAIDWHGQLTGALAAGHEFISVSVSDGVMVRNFSTRLSEVVMTKVEAIEGAL